MSDFLNYGVDAKKEAAYEAGFERGYYGYLWSIRWLKWGARSYEINSYFAGFEDGRAYRKRFNRGSLNA